MCMQNHKTELMYGKTKSNKNQIKLLELQTNPFVVKQNMKAYWKETPTALYIKENSNH